MVKVIAEVMICLVNGASSARWQQDQHFKYNVESVWLCNTVRQITQEGPPRAASTTGDSDPLLLTGINFNPSTDK